MKHPPFRWAPHRWAPFGGLLLLALLAAGGSAAAGETEVARDDGVLQGKQSRAGSGHAVLLEAPRRARWIETVRIHGARYGGGYDPEKTFFRVAVCDEDLRPLHVQEVPYARFEAGGFGWVDVALDLTFEVPDRFHVVAAFDPTQTRGVFVGWSKAEEGASSYALPGGTATPLEAGRAWMIRAVLSTRPPKGVPRRVEVAVDDGTKTGHRSLGGGVHAVELKRPSGSWWVRSVCFFGQRYGGGYDPERTTFRIAIRERDGDLLHEIAVPYARVPAGGFAWVDVPLEAVVKVPSRFQLTIDFAPTRTKGVYLGFSGEAPRDVAEATWMVRARLVDEEPEPAREAPASRDPASAPAAPAGAEARGRYLADFEAMAETIGRHFPAFGKKGVDWQEVLDAHRSLFAEAPDDAAHVQNAHRLLARLGDLHSGIADAKVEAHVPSFDGLRGAGLWIAHDRGRLVLRAALAGHDHLREVPPGSVLLSIDGRPALDVFEEVRARLRTWHGWSSDAFLDARLSFQFFPFGDAPRLRATFLTLPEKRVVAVDLGPWGPGGRGLSRAAVTLPEGLAAEGAVVSKRLEGDLGYLRILGGMDEATERAFFEALDGLRGVKGILLDARGMGGGSDRPAWSMAGRFFAERRRLAHDPDLVPTGAWQFEGPVVLLQDERMVSSAETFTWAMVETGRAVGVGRPTGGATIIPRVFEVPSGLFRYRLGCRDRETSVKGVHPEGVGTPPAVFVPYDAWLLARHPDPARAVGLDVLRRLAAGQDAEVVAGAYGGILGARPDALEGAWKAFLELEAPAGLDLPDLPAAAPARMIDEEIAVHGAAANPRPDLEGAARRLERLAAVAEAVGEEAAAGRARAFARAPGEDGQGR